MSSTNRSAARSKHISDYYKTPVASISDFLMEFFDDNPELDFIGRENILDPCAGGATNPYQSMSYPEALAFYTTYKPAMVTTVDNREDSLAQIKDDFLFWEPDREYGCIITNPPFNIALDVIQKALRIVKEGGLVIMLLRLNFFGSRERKNFFQDNMPVFSYVHSRRMKFTNTTGTDSIEYMHSVWIKGLKPKFTKLRVI